MNPIDKKLAWIQRCVNSLVNARERMPNATLVQRLEQIKIVGVVNHRHDGEVIDRAIEIIREKNASDSFLDGQDVSNEEKRI